MNNTDARIHVAVEVSGGVVRNVYADAGVDVTVFDLDVSDFPDDEEALEAEKKETALRRFIRQDGVSRVW